MFPLKRLAVLTFYFPGVYCNLPVGVLCFYCYQQSNKRWTGILACSLVFCLFFVPHSTVSLHLTLSICFAILRETTCNKTNLTIDYLIEARIKFLWHLISVIMKWHWMKHCYSRVYYTFISLFGKNKEVKGGREKERERGKEEGIFLSDT